MVLEIARNGRVATRLAGTINSADGPVSLIQPSKIHKIRGGFLHEDEKHPRGVGNDEIFRLSDDLQVKDSIPIKGRVVESGITLSTILDWAPIGPEGLQVLAFGELMGPDGGISAFLRLHQDGSSEIYRQTVLDDVAASVIELYAKNISYVAGLGESAYMLFLEEEAGIGEVTPGVPGVRNLPVPVDFRRSPVLYRNPSQKGEAHRIATAQYETIEAARMPIGLYGWQGHLYLLAKEKMTSQFRTTWWLIKLDPDNGDEIGRAKLPSTASHLTVIPGDGEFWTLIEKGPVQGVGRRHAPRMNTSSVVFFPGQWLDKNPTRGSLGASKPPVTCIELPSE